MPFCFMYDFGRRRGNEMLPIKQNLVPAYKYPIKCPFAMKARKITVHNTWNDASAVNEIAYMVRNNSTTSFHYAVDDVQIIQGIPDNRNAWHAGDGARGPGNLTSIGVEICYSMSGGSRFLKAEKNAAALVAHLLKKHRLSIHDVVPHKYWSGKYCPHRTLDMGWDRFLAMVRAELGGSSLNETPSTWSPPTSGLTVDGAWGAMTTLALQRKLKVRYVDGIISNQYAANKKYYPGVVGSWRWLNRPGKGGSATIRALQSLIGATADGFAGYGTATALQRYLNRFGYGLTVDGHVGAKTVVALQKWLNG